MTFYISFERGKQPYASSGKTILQLIHPNHWPAVIEAGKKLAVPGAEAVKCFAEEPDTSYE